MRKVYLLLTLFIVSLFFSSNVYAAEQIYEVSEEQINILTSDTFISLRETVIEYCNTNNKKYIIACSSTSSCVANIYDLGGVTMSSENLSGTELVFPALNIKKSTGYKLSNGSLTTYSYANIYNYFYITKEKKFTYISFIDSNDESLTFKNNVKLVYNNFTLEVPASTPFPSLYQFNEIMNTPADKFIEEKEIINNFYLTISQKIGDFASNFINNYYFMLIIGIFILIFIFEIIRRRLI